MYNVYQSIIWFPKKKKTGLRIRSGAMCAGRLPMDSIGPALEHWDGEDIDVENLDLM